MAINDVGSSIGGFSFRFWLDGGARKGLRAPCLIEDVTEQLPAVTRLALLDHAGGVPWRGRSAWRRDVR